MADRSISEPGQNGTAPGTDPLARLVRVRRELAQALQSARVDLAALEEDNQRAHFELQLMLRSRGRRAFMRAREGARTALAALLHPVSALRRASAGVAARSGLATCAAVYGQVRFRRTPLDNLPVEASPASASAVRWLGQVRLANLARSGLSCPPAAGASFRVQPPPGGRLVAYCGVLPGKTAPYVDAVEFTLTARAESGRERSRTLCLRPAWRLGDRGWRRMAVSLPHDRVEELHVTLAAQGANGRDTPVQAVWGDARIEQPRRIAELMRAARAELQRSGFRSLFHKMRQLRVTDEASVRYRQWIARNTPTAESLAQMSREAASLPYQPRVSVITPVYNTDPVLLRACIESVRQQAYPHWELCLADDASDAAATTAVLREYAGRDPRITITRLATNSHISTASNAALALATGDFVAFLDHDDELAPEALFEVARCLNAHQDADMIYSDEDKLDLAGQRCDPHFKPDWSPEYFRSVMYTCHLMVVRRSLVGAIGGFRVGYEGAQDYDLALRVTARTSRIHHIPKVLYRWRKIPGSAAAELEAKPWALKAARRALHDHLRERAMDAEVLPGAAPGLFRVRFRILDQPLVTIVVPTDDRSRDVNGRAVRLLPNCLQSVVQKTAYANYELLVVDNGRLQPATESFLMTIPHRRVSYVYEGAFNFAHKLNFAVRHARGSHLVVFNDDLEVISSEWLTAMLEHSQQPEVGAVGAKLLFPDGRLQHIGIVLGVCGVAAHAYHMQPGSSSGYAGSALVTRNYSAVTGACLMTRRAIFDEVGGFNERLAIDFNDVDYCLRVRCAGYRIVYTPYAQLYHLESGSHGARLQAPAEVDEMRRTWGDILERDPYYNPNLTKDFPDYRLAV